VHIQTDKSISKKHNGRGGEGIRNWEMHGRKVAGQTKTNQAPARRPPGMHLTFQWRILSCKGVLFLKAYEGKDERGEKPNKKITPPQTKDKKKVPGVEEIM